MSNTLIQIKRSLTTSQPPSLNVAEIAYSYQSNTFFIGTPDGTGTIAIGGKSYLDIQNNIYTLVNSAYGAANSGTSSGLAAANQAGVIANAAFGHSNTTYAAVNSAFGVINAAFTQSNTDNVRLSAAYVTTNAGYVVANAAYGYANASNTWVNSTFVKLTSGSQTISGDISITGNLIISGNYTTIGVQTLTVNDSLIYLANNNTVGDVVDIGFMGNYGNGTANVHTGLYRSAGNKQYYLFQGYDLEPGANNTLVPYANNMVNAVLNADLITSNLSLGGANAIVWIKAAYDNSNGAFGVTNAAFGHSNTTYAAVNSAFGVINAAFTQSNTDNVRLSAAYVLTNSAYTVTNSAYTVANAAFGYANVANSYLQNTFSSAANISSGILPSARLSGSYTGITGVGTITTGTWNGSTVNVGYGGTGIVSATLNGVLFGGGGNAAFQVTSAGTEGQVLTASSTGVPQFSMLSGGTF